MSCSTILPESASKCFQGRTRSWVGDFMASLLEVLFGCSHKNFSFPITKRPGQRLSPAAQLTGTYVACLGCGKEFAYDWHEMKIVESNNIKPNTLAANAAESFAGK